MNHFLGISKRQEGQEGYELLDFGDGEKLERWGAYTLRRPDPQALSKKLLPEDRWEASDAAYRQTGERGKWVKKEGMPESWEAELGGFKFTIELSPFKHTGAFPEQLSNWEWTGSLIRTAREANPARAIRVLNLFGYTGGATLAAAAAGAEVAHVDASRSSIGRARRNAELSGLSGAPIRWLCDDARKFVERELRRGSRYDAIIMDPPAYGRGAKGELWKLEENLMPLLDVSAKLLTNDPLFFILNGYASGYSALAYENALSETLAKKNVGIESGELAIEDSAGRLLPAGIYARWSRKI